MTDFNQCFDKIIIAEGGYINDSTDPGGETNFGISKRAYPNVDIKNLTLEQAKIIYKNDYWDKIRGDEITYPLNLFLFDCAVNQGVSVAITLLQKSAGIPQDGILGIQTLNAIKKTTGIETRFMANRALRYIETKNFEKYGFGWFKRIFKITKEA